MIGSQIVAGRRIRFPDHEYVAGPWSDDELFVHLYDVHEGYPGAGSAQQADLHSKAHEGYPVTRLAVLARSKVEVESYLGFGAEIVAANPLAENGSRPAQLRVEVVIDIPVEHDQWLIDRLASGLLRAEREFITDAPAVQA